MLVSVQYRCTVCAERTIGSKIVLDTGDEDQVEACFCPFGDGGSVDVRKVCGLCLMYHRLRSHVGRTRWNS
jgi:hypothetical protein